MGDDSQSNWPESNRSGAASVTLVEAGGAEGASGDDEREGDGGALLELVLAAHEQRLAREAPPARIDGVVIGRLAALLPGGAPVVRFTGCASPEGVVARAAAAVGEADLGRAVALMFEGADPSRPILMGLVHNEAELATSWLRRAGDANRDGVRPQVKADGERVELTADKEIVLRCGKASITLTRAGKILVRGAYVLTRSSGVNRIQGGSVQIN